eukprot:GHVT01061748.1.p1 GENE.GHVT01061748.1~~GHVT01061748.1.p1  ORF type:complete len:626 (-),score=190.89 GHVT01061748.1:485-2362(-)
MALRKERGGARRRRWKVFLVRFLFVRFLFVFQSQLLVSRASVVSQETALLDLPMVAALRLLGRLQADPKRLLIDSTLALTFFGDVFDRAEMGRNFSGDPAAARGVASLSWLVALDARPQLLSKVLGRPPPPGGPELFPDGPAPPPQEREKSFGAMAAAAAVQAADAQAAGHVGNEGPAAASAFGPQSNAYLATLYFDVVKEVTNVAAAVAKQNLKFDVDGVCVEDALSSRCPKHGNGRKAKKNRKKCVKAVAESVATTCAARVFLHDLHATDVALQERRLLFKPLAKLAPADFQLLEAARNEAVYAALLRFLPVAWAATAAAAPGTVEKLAVRVTSRLPLVDGEGLRAALVLALTQPQPDSSCSGVWACSVPSVCKSFLSSVPSFGLRLPPSFSSASSTAASSSGYSVASVTNAIHRLLSGENGKDEPPWTPPSYLPSYRTLHLAAITNANGDLNVPPFEPTSFLQKEAENRESDDKQKRRHRGIPKRSNSHVPSFIQAAIQEEETEVEGGEDLLSKSSSIAEHWDNQDKEDVQQLLQRRRKRKNYSDLEERKHTVDPLVLLLANAMMVVERAPLSIRKQFGMEKFVRSAAPKMRKARRKFAFKARRALGSSGKKSTFDLVIPDI